MIGKDYKWYALYTRSQHEKQLQKDLDRLDIDSYLPVISSIRQWSDRNKIVYLPLFPNYIFVKASCREYSVILEHQSVIGFVKLGKEPAEVPFEILEIIRIAVSKKIELVRSPKRPGEGQRVIITRGPMKGFEGMVVNYIDKYYLLVELKQLYQYLMIRINIDSVLFLEKNKIICPDCVT